nr:glycogen debranching enzyme [Treponemataceae bacterium]
RDGRKPFHSINFITSHDGFTMNDLVSYNGKHNEENGEGNRDGSDNNNSYNYGFEGPSTNAALESLRTRQIKNIMLTLLLSQGTPMLLCGDEIRRSQNGNNNAYCQDSPMNWLDWNLKESNCELFRFVRMLIAFRLRHPVFRRPEFFQGRNLNYNNLPDICWFSEDGKPVDWSKANHFVAFRLDGGHAEIFSDNDDNDFYVMLNSSNQDKSIRIPKAINGKRWYRIIDTSVPYPEDFLTNENEEILDEKNVYVLPARSAAVLLGK